MDLHPNTANGDFAASIFRELSDVTSTGTPTDEVMELVGSQAGKMIECIHPTPDNAVSESFTFEKGTEKVNISSDVPCLIK